jgi:hypothetical protein
MSIIKKTIRLIPLSTSGSTIINNFVGIKIPLSSSNDFTGLQQEIDSLTSFTAIDLVNPVTDAETRKYKIEIINPVVTVKFGFYSTPISNWFDNFIIAGFTFNESTKNATNFLNSFFILDLFDTYDVNTQIKLFTTYLTKKGNSASSDFSITGSNNQFYYWYIPVSYIEAQTGTTSTGYTRFIFYNAKSGKTTIFYNSDNAALKTSERMHFKVIFNHVNRTWKFETVSYPNIIAREMINNQAFADKVNNTVDTVNNLQQQPPSGNTFTYSGGTAHYLTT